MKQLLAIISIAVLSFTVASAQAEDCVNVDLGAEIVNGSYLSLFYSLENCGTEPGTVTLAISFSMDGTELGVGEAAAMLPAGEEYTHQFELPILPMTPAGIYTLCVTATIGMATDTSCATVTIDAAGNVLAFSPKPEEPATIEASWGKFKQLYQ